MVDELHIQLLKLLIQINENSICVIDKTSQRIGLFWECSLIIWGEVPMQHQHCPYAIDHMLRDICSDDKPIGGLTAMFGRNFC
jgi:hypothetical protein